jgi:hypothetical protein
MGKKRRPSIDVEGVEEDYQNRVSQQVVKQQSNEMAK